MTKLEKTLRSITDIIVQHCEPDEIILFGSYAKGCDRLDSDLDILVIGDFRQSKFIRNLELNELLNQFPIRIDIHLLTSGEFEIECQKPFLFLNTLQFQSISLYKKPGGVTKISMPKEAFTKIQLSLEKPKTVGRVGGSS